MREFEVITKGIMKKKNRINFMSFVASEWVRFDNPGCGGKGTTTGKRKYEKNYTFSARPIRRVKKESDSEGDRGNETEK